MTESQAVQLSLILCAAWSAVVPQVGQRYGLPLLSPVDDAGRFTDEAGPFSGLAVQGDGNEAVVKASGRPAPQLPPPLLPLPPSS